MMHRHSDFDEYTPAPDTRSIWKLFGLVASAWTVIVLVYLAIMMEL